MTPRRIAMGSKALLIGAADKVPQVVFETEFMGATLGTMMVPLDKAIEAHAALGMAIATVQARAHTDWPPLPAVDSCDDDSLKASVRNGPGVAL